MISHQQQRSMWRKNWKTLRFIALLSLTGRIFVFLCISTHPYGKCVFPSGNFCLSVYRQMESAACLRYANQRLSRTLSAPLLITYSYGKHDEATRAIKTANIIENHKSKAWDRQEGNTARTLAKNNVTVTIYRYTVKKKKQQHHNTKERKTRWKKV